MACKHESAILTCSRYAEEAGYKPRCVEEIAKAAGIEKEDVGTIPDSSTYPQPLLLPGDDLAEDPEWPEQNLAETVQFLVDHKGGAPGRNVVYVAGPPAVSKASPDGMKEWTKLRLPEDHRTNLMDTQSPRTQDVVAYLAAYYHGMAVKVLPEQLSWAKWEDERTKLPKNKKAAIFPSAIALQTSSEAGRVRCRQIAEGPCTMQLNLNDILDTAIAILPEDAFALLMLIEHDIYEHEDDEFCCGRAYGGSRVACVSMARYHPAADVVQDVDLEHPWPVSHCSKYVESMMPDAPVQPPKKKIKSKPDSTRAQSGPVRAAMDAYPKNLEKVTLEAFAGLWLGRLCRTASHELGHCFGIDHCLYYACMMQGTYSVAEDSRQPPYLCPVDLAKVLYTTGATAKEHHEALLRFCKKFDKQSAALFWTPFAAWLRGRLVIGI